MNLIPYNPIGAGVSGTVYRRPSPERLREFLAILRERRVVAHFRDTRGDDVDAACGQLRETTARAELKPALVPPGVTALGTCGTVGEYNGASG